MKKVDIFTGKRTLMLDIEEEQLLFCTEPHDTSELPDEEKVICE